MLTSGHPLCEVLTGFMLQVLVVGEVPALAAKASGEGWAMTQIRYEPVEFRSQEITLRGRLYLPRRLPAPVVVMAHGFSATIPMVLDRYAEAFHDSGLAVLAFDQPGLGLSDGHPRGEINPWVSARAYRSAVDHAVGRDEIDPDRIALWGDSLSARVALVATATDDRVRALVCQVPAMGTVVPVDSEASTPFDEISAVLREGDVRRSPDTWKRLPVVSPDQESVPSALLPLTAFRWFIEYGARYGSRWSNRVVLTAATGPPDFDPFACAQHVGVPSQFVMSPDDEMPGADSDVARALIARLSGPTDVVEVEGGHFGIVEHPSAAFVHASAAESAFLTRVLSVG